MKQKLLGISLALALVVTGTFAGALPASADTVPTVFLPAMGDDGIIEPRAFDAEEIVDEAGPPSANSTPIYLPKDSYPTGNPCAADIFGGRYTLGLKIGNFVPAGIYSSNGLSVEITRSDYLFFDWRLISIPAGQSIGAVIVEGKVGSSAFEYDPPYPVEDTGLHTSGFTYKKTFLLRKVRKAYFCLVENGLEPGIDLTKYVSIYAEAVQPEFYDANNGVIDPNDPQSALGVSIHDKVTWRYVATNTGNTDLYNVAVDDDFEGAPDICFDVLVADVLLPPYDHIVFHAHPELWGEDPGFNLPITLAPGAVLDCFTWTGDGPADPPEVGGELGDSYMNTGTVTANTTPDVASPTVGASDVSWYVVNSIEE